MKKLPGFVFLAALTVMLPACGATRPASAGAIAVQASASVETATALYADVKGFVGLFLPFLPPERAAQISRAGAKVDQLLALARAATSAAERAVLLARAAEALAQFKIVAGA